MLRLALSLLVLAAVGCEPAGDVSPPGSASVRLEQRMGSEPDPGFARAVRPRAFVFPADHAAHPAYTTEWWYFTGNLRTESGRAFGYQLTLFRIALKPGAAAGDSDWRAQQIYMGHLAVSDIAAARHHSAERFSRAAAGLAGAQPEPLRIWLGAWSIQGAVDGPFPLRLEADAGDIAIALTVEAGWKPVVLQGNEGLSRKGAAPGNASYYYSLTRLPTRGEIRIDGQRYRVAGDSWFDREWSSSALAADQAGWDWFSLQLDDGRDLMFYRMRGQDGQAQRFSNGVLVDVDGTRHRLAHDDVMLQTLRSWRSDDGADYPVGWRMQVPRYGLDLDVAAAFDDQEMRHTVRYWEGAVVVNGSHSGVGYLELSGYAD